MKYIILLVMFTITFPPSSQDSTTCFQHHVLSLPTYPIKTSPKILNLLNFPTTNSLLLLSTYPTALYQYFILKNSSVECFSSFPPWTDLSFMFPALSKQGIKTLECSTVIKGRCFQFWLDCVLVRLGECQWEMQNKGLDYL